MLLWTVVPPEAIFPADLSDTAYEEIDYQGTQMLVEKISSTECRIVRLLSTNPVHYLQTELQPGNVVCYQAIGPAK